MPPGCGTSVPSLPWRADLGCGPTAVSSRRASSGRFCGADVLCALSCSIIPVPVGRTRLKLGRSTGVFSMTQSWNEMLPPSSGFNFKATFIADDWFTIYAIATNLFVFYEPRHYEETLATLIIGREKAALIDTGCGIGDLRKAVRAVTDKPIVVVNTHTHTDHIGSNHQFGDIVMFDHPLARRVAKQGVSAQIMHNDILADHLVIKPW